MSGCKNRGGHEFPSNKRLRKAWIEGVEREDSWKPSKHSVVCSSHFLPDDYLTINAYGKYGIGTGYVNRFREGHGHEY